uniref:L,D-TPase catalytic domain-containing protein n=1 Tax=Desulfovibrio sp. U5L TaxID=596152 RepID=I2Q0C8_9BACT
MRGWMVVAVVLGLVAALPHTSVAGRPETAGHKTAVTAVAAVPAVAGPAYVPVADGGGLDLYMAGLAKSGEARYQLSLPDDQMAEFLASKNRYSIEVRLSQRTLYLYENLPDGTRHLARRYAVAVPGRDMEAPQGWGVVTGISFEPWWRPTPAMKERALKKGRQLPEVVKPGVKENPMGPFKIILSHGYGYRIHGNNNPGSIGRPVTSGCIRMQNDEGKDMAKLIDVGTEVVFLQ